MSPRFAVIGVAGFIAPRHLKAIHDVGGEVIAAYDLTDSVGVMDQYFPAANFFTEFEALYSFLDDKRRMGRPADFVTICSPNYLHKPHIHAALRLGANVICEKPLVLKTTDLDDLHIISCEAGRDISAILQLRLHPAIINLKNQIENGPADKIYDVDLSYFTSRGQWYHRSWKGAPEKSGGIAANIGVHFFDMLSFVFGELKMNALHHRDTDISAGYLEFQRARVRWLLSINRDHLPPNTPEGQTTYRSVTVEGDEIEFSGGFTELHTRSYEEILAGRRFGLDEVRPSIEIVEELRHVEPNRERGQIHPGLARILEA